MSSKTKNVYRPNRKSEKSSSIIQNQGYYSNLVKNIYSDNKLLKERIKYSHVKPTDPILQSKNELNLNANRVFSPKRMVNMETPKVEIPKKHAQTSKSVDGLKSSYNVFYTLNKNNSNKEIQEEITKKKKSFKKLFINEKNASMIEDDTSTSYFRTKKLFPITSSKSSLNIHIANNDYKNGNSTSKKFDSEHYLMKKEHIIDNKGGVMTTKKHFSLNSLQPSKSVLRINDKQKLLPSEYCERHARPYNRSYSSIMNNSSINKNQIKNSSTGKLGKNKYPYAKDHMKDIITGDKMTYKNDFKYTQKISKNPFDILKKVPKFDWEK